MLLVEYFEEQERLNPDSIALEFEGKRITYKALNEASNRLAHHLRVEVSIMPNDVVGVIMDRSEHAIIALLGIMKSGAAFLPIDPVYPRERKKYMCNDANLKIVLTDSKHLKELAQSEIAVLNLEQNELLLNAGFEWNPKPVNTSEDLAYVLYTSGTTGVPKGVQITIGNISNYILWANEYYFKNTLANCFGLFTSLSFDLTMTTIFCPLLRGGKIFIYPEIALNEIIEHAFSVQSEINILKVTPSHIKIAEHLNLSQTNVEHIILGGERLMTQEVVFLKQLHPAIKIYNEYGPTETTVGCTVALIDEHDSVITIGQPIGGAFIYLLDDSLNLLPLGAKGELYIGGLGVAKGYLNQKDLTESKFIPDPFSEKGGILYKSGDTGRWLENGELEYLGRKDNQIKIRGYRVEIDEIEFVIKSYPGIVNAHVNVLDEQLFAVVAIKSDQAISDVESSIRQFCLLVLPDYMVPVQFIIVDQIPLTANGKVNKKALLELLEQSIDKKEFVGPGNPIEQALVAIWEEVLGKKQVSTEDNFFRIGGQSLKALQIVARIYKELNLSIDLNKFYLNPTVKSLSIILSNQQSDIFKSIVPVTSERHYPLSHAQRRMWILDQLEKGQSAYNIFSGYYLRGLLDKEVFFNCFDQVIRRHEILRTTFISVDGEPRQLVHEQDDFDFNVKFCDLRADINKKLTVQGIIDSELNVIFDLDNFLIRAQLVQLEPDYYLFLFTTHHIISDGWSSKILIKEIIHLYESGINKTDISLPVLNIQYKDYTHWQNDQLTGEYLSVHKNYWLKQFAGDLPVLEFPQDYPRPLIKTYRGDKVELVLTESIVEGLKGISQTKEVTLFTTLLSTIYALIYNYTGEQDQIIGTPVAGRDHHDLENQIGLYMNIIPLRTQLDAHDTFDTLLDKVKEVTIAGYTHQVYPFDRLVSDLKLERDMSRSPLFDIIVALQNIDAEGIQSNIQGFDVTLYETKEITAKYDLSFLFSEFDNQLRLSIVYNVDLYEKQSIERLAGHYSEIIASIVQKTSAKIGELNWLTLSERQILLRDFNDTAFDYPSLKTVQELFEAQVALNPERIAVTDASEKITYRELNFRANKIAAYLRTVHFVHPGDVVAVMLDRSVNLIVALLGVLKSGGAYLPIDSSYPEERKAHMLSDSKAKLLLTDSHKMFDLPNYGGPLFAIDVQLDMLEAQDENPLNTNTSEDIAYVIYTSGSTGVPKGVMIEHHSLVNLCYWHIDTFGVSADSRASIYSAVGFDACTWEIWPYLLSGSFLYALPENEKLDDKQLELNFSKNGITHCFLPTVLVEQLHAIQSTVLEGRIVLTGGDELKLKQPFRQGLVNNYGPTESTVVATSSFLNKRSESSRISIGKPIYNTQVYILDAASKLLPIGVTGEICISGAGLARGYINQDKLAEHPFIEHPFIANERLYRTGDLGKWLKDGTIEFVGRKDNQIKIRGHRIEIGEIESVLINHTQVVAAAVCLDKNTEDDKVLVAYIQSELQDKEIRSYLKKHLPYYMIPSIIVFVEKIPLTSHGKLDRKNLSLYTSLRENTIIVAPFNDTESGMLGIWKEVLEKEQISVEDNFFDIGGHSMKGVQIASRIFKIFHVKVELRDLFLYPTIRTLSEVVLTAKKDLYKEIAPVDERAFYDLSYAQRGIWIQSQLNNNLIAYNIPAAFIIEGDLDRAILARSLSSLMERHEILRTTFAAIDGEPKQVIQHSFDLSQILVYQDLRTEENRESLWGKIALEEAETSFDLSKDPLLRIKVIELSECRFVFLLTMHHIISDGWSMSILMNEMFAFYEAYRSNLPNPLVPLTIHYKDYAMWQNEQLQAYSRHTEYWVNEYKDTIPLLNISQNDRPAVKTYSSETVQFEMDENLTQSLVSLSRQCDVSLFVVFLSLTKLLLYRYSKNEDMIIGTPVGARTQSGLENQMGNFLNIVGIRTKLIETETVLQLFDKVKNKVLDAFEHQVVPFDYILDTLNVPVDPSRNAIFDVALTFNNYNLRNSSSKLEGLKITAVSSGFKKVKTDIWINIHERENTIIFSMDYNTDLFHAGFINQFIYEMQSLITKVIETRTLNLGDLNKHVSEAWLHHSNELKMERRRQNSFKLKGN